MGCSCEKTEIKESKKKKKNNKQILKHRHKKTI